VQVLTGVLLVAREGRLRVAATDMEISVRAHLDAQITAEGAALVPGRVLTDLVRLLPQEEVTLELEADARSLRIASGQAEYRLRVLTAEDFPQLPEVDEERLPCLDAEPFLDTIACVARAAGRDESRPVLTGILVRIESGTLVMAGTDSYRLSVKETPLAGGAPDLEAIIPARALDEVRRIAAGAGTIAIGAVGNHVAFVAGDAQLTSRRIDGQFPDYKSLAPKPEEYTLEAVLPRAEILDIVRRVSVMAQRTAPLRLRFADGELHVSVQAQDVGEARESLPVAFSGEGLEIGFNADYLRDGIESVSGDELVLRLINPLRPGLIQSAEEGFWYLIMPIRLAG